MPSQQIRYLLDRYIRGELTESEQHELAAIMQDPQQEDFVRQELAALLSEEGADSAAGWEPVLARVLSVDKTGGVVRPMRYAWRRWAVAAIVFLALGGGVLFVLFRGKERQAANVAAVASKRIAPGGDRAILTLAGGQQIVLGNVQNGMISRQGNMRVMKLDSGRLAYAAASGPEAAGVLWNIITTPRGGKYQVTLSDGTRVWLNAESSLRFPTAFTGKNRAVTLTGEAYFDVAADKDKPFLVQTGETETLVLGTQFDINSYTDEGAVKTTLLEGAVRMGLGSQQALLQPGEQGQFDADKRVIVTRSVNTKAVVAWKDGYYYFDRTPVQSVMRQIARWYDVDVVYEGAVPKDEIVGKIPRSAYVSEVLHIMELIGVHFRIEGRTIIVLG